MAQAVWPLTQRKFGETTRRDHWWVQPLAGVSRALDVHCLLHLGGVPGESLRVRPLPLPVLFAAALRRQRTRVVRAETGVVARRAPFFRRAPDPLGARRIPVHLLLLPRRLLQGVLGGPAVVHGWEPRKKYLGERSFPLVLQNIHRYFLYLGLIFICILLRRCREVVLVHRTDGASHFGIGVGSLLLDGQRGSARAATPSAATRCGT